MTVEIVNLNKVRKTHNRELKERQAEINRVKFGQSKAEKRRNKYESQRQDKELSGKQQDKELSGKQLDEDGPDID